MYYNFQQLMDLLHEGFKIEKFENVNDNIVMFYILGYEEFKPGRLYNFNCPF